MKHLAAALLLAVAAAAAPIMNDPLKTLDALPDLTQNLLAKYPSMGMGLAGPDDMRLGRFARETGTPFKLASNVAGATAPSYILVDPTRLSGFLWRRSFTVVAVDAAQIQGARAGKSPLSPDVVAFLKSVQWGTGPGVGSN